MSHTLRRTTGDLIASGVIAAIALALLLIAFLTAPVRSAQLDPAPEELENVGRLAVAPTKLSESFRLPDHAPDTKPVVVNGVIVTYNDGAVTATTPAGETAWTYHRPNELCALSQAWGKVVATYRDNAGCGDVVAIDALTGQYAGTRSAIAPDMVTSVSSNDRIGYVGSTRAELWRSDMVRTVEYGYVEAPQEPDMQPNRCQITSALTRTELFAVTETCADGSFLRLQDATPEDSRKPEIYSGVDISEESYLVAISQDAAAVYDPGTSEILTYDKEGTLIAASSVPDLPGPLTLDNGVHPLPVADLPHHMTYHEGDYLVLMEPSKLAATGVFQGALGTGFAAGDRLLYASNGGIAVVDWDANAVDRIIPVDRGTYSGPVSIDSAGATIVEKRGDEVVVLAAQ
ncbi:hypothetical protein V6D40_02135 [Corynebacterium sp. Q4381]|uniref:Rv3212 family protein n=1 Tax=Corynebacterium sp. Marseille-Q4381 TaxID=3121597 RepID=UPI002FE54F9B